MVMVEEKPALVYIRDDIAEIILLVATNKGAFFYYSDPERRHWDVSGPHFLGSIVNHVVIDPRDNKTILASVKPYSSDATIYRSTDFGKNWTVANQPPKFIDTESRKQVVSISFISPGHAKEKHVWYAGTSPAGLFRSIDRGNSWEIVEGFNNNKLYLEWTKIISDRNHDLPELHSIIIDPTNKNQLYIAISLVGIFESTDYGKSWSALNKGLPKSNDNEMDYRYDTHSIALHPTKPNKLFQQNKLGIYKIERPENKWINIGKNMPQEIGSSGYTIQIHPDDPNTIWVFPIESTNTWVKVCPDGMPALYCSKDGGSSWFRQDIGLPMRNAWFYVSKNSLCTDCMSEVGLYFGTNTGSLWMSNNEGNSWRQIAVHLPKVLAIESGKIFKK